jgi:hypothetical protein
MRFLSQKSEAPHGSYEECDLCEDTGFSLSDMRRMIAFKEVPLTMTNANTIILGNPVPFCKCECHEASK